MENILNGFYKKQKQRRKRVIWKKNLVHVSYTYSREEYDRTMEPIDRSLFLIPKHIREMGNFDYYDLLLDNDDNYEYDEPIHMLLFESSIENEDEHGVNDYMCYEDFLLDEVNDISMYADEEYEYDSSDDECMPLITENEFTGFPLKRCQVVYEQRNMEYQPVLSTEKV